MAAKKIMSKRGKNSKAPKAKRVPSKREIRLHAKIDKIKARLKSTREVSRGFRKEARTHKREVRRLFNRLKRILRYADVPSSK